MIRLPLQVFFCQIVIFLLQGSNCLELLEKEYGKVILVNAIFRHGERSIETSYPTDPYSAYQWPDGQGQLLQVGKQRVFEEGEWFKKRYRMLLGTMNSHTNITMLSSGIDRTIMTAECFLTGFFIPRSDQIVAKNLKWHAVPIHSNQLWKKNVLMKRDSCAMYAFSMRKYFKSKLAKNIFDKYQRKGLFKILQNNSGFKFSRKNISDCYEKLQIVHDVFSVHNTTNFKLPSWAKEIFPEPLSSARTRLLVGAFSKLRMKKLTAGPLLKSIRENMVRKQRHKSTQIFHFYSGHDKNLMVIMNALKIFNNIWPPYRSSLVFELREKKSDKYYVTIFYKNSTTSDPVYLHLPHCEKRKICPLETFLNVTKHLITEDVDLECKIPEK